MVSFEFYDPGRVLQLSLVVPSLGVFSVILPPLSIDWLLLLVGYHHQPNDGLWLVGWLVITTNQRLIDRWLVITTNQRLNDRWLLMRWWLLHDAGCEIIW